MLLYVKTKENLYILTIAVLPKKCSNFVKNIVYLNNLYKISDDTTTDVVMIGMFFTFCRMKNAQIKFSVVHNEPILTVTHSMYMYYICGS